MGNKIAYFSMEIAVESDIPTYSGGLGVLAGDTLKSATDMKVPMIGVSLLYNNGYFNQFITNGWQRERYTPFDPRAKMKELPDRVKVPIGNEEVSVRAWLYEIKGNSGYKVPILFLDTNGAEERQWPADGSTGQGGLNRTWKDSITDYLYGADKDYRLKQEIVLGIGGVRMLQKLGYDIDVYHINEGHPALLTLELLLQNGLNPEKVRERCVATTHTPVPAGHDRFSLNLVDALLPNEYSKEYKRFAGEGENVNNTLLALNLSRYANAVSKKNGEVSRKMFNGYNIDSITNGVHYTWTADEMQKVFDKFAPQWRDGPSRLYDMPGNESTIEQIKIAHAASKKRLIDNVKEVTGETLDPGLMTIVFAKRAATYKRGDLLFADLDRLENIGAGKIQLIYAGKAHPQDDEGKKIIYSIHENLKKLKGKIKGAYMPDYNMAQGALLTAGADVWLNHPDKPQEASGTSGMKAAFNGVPSLSVLDGWWIEGHKEGITGWSIGSSDDGNWKGDVRSMYEKLEHITEIFGTGRFDKAMIGSIIHNASFFNTRRMLHEYLAKAYNSSSQAGDRRATIQNLERMVA